MGEHADGGTRSAGIGRRPDPFVLGTVFPILTEDCPDGSPLRQTVKGESRRELAQLPLPISGERVREIAAAVASVILSSQPWGPLGEVIPLLPTLKQPVKSATLSARLCHVLKREEVVEWHQLSPLRLEQLLTKKNFGFKTAKELLVEAISAGLRAQPDPTAVPTSAAEWRASVTAIVRGVIRSLGATSWQTVALPTPADQQAVSGPSDLKDVGAFPFGQLYDRAMTEIGERESLVLKLRRHRHPPTTLQEIASRLGVSRERVRQLERSAAERFESVLGDFRETDIQVLELRDFLGSVAAETTVTRATEGLLSGARDVPAAKLALLGMAGYSLQDGRWVRDPT